MGSNLGSKLRVGPNRGYYAAVIGLYRTTNIMSENQYRKKQPAARVKNVMKKSSSTIYYFQFCLCEGWHQAVQKLRDRGRRREKSRAIKKLEFCYNVVRRQVSSHHFRIGTVSLVD